MISENSKSENRSKKKTKQNKIAQSGIVFVLIIPSRFCVRFFFYLLIFGNS